MFEQNSTRIGNIRKSPILEIEKEVAKIRTALGDWRPDGNDCVTNFMPGVRMAWLVIQKDHPEVLDIAQKLDACDETSDALLKMLSEFDQAADAFLSLSAMCDIAMTRIKSYSNALATAEPVSAGVI